MKERIFRPKDIAERFNVSVETVLTWIRTGELRASNIAARQAHRPRWVILESAVDDFIELREYRPIPTTSRRRKRGRRDIPQHF